MSRKYLFLLLIATGIYTIILIIATSVAPWSLPLLVFLGVVIGGIIGYKRRPIPKETLSA